ncbi:3-hydroxyisobutyrate dehydrogenase (plasmid) [Streptomyces clavuligerus]|uniref:3-hydroxyisobutyrate dehydrogenase n=2 Tax=Streptomyces clavuligerus TaxID=1901 RepID=D5SKN8_STRCL|nr:NAD(P)-dependent oxidoreductase [Streptomyces clavuligerus]ANW22385.1 3-hydroxyisobutyrate dehydrogenase [Streptomyces clavuligerus]EFG04481.1 3-hydroxyisobutyrate dehydrogenase [Streptomyces clavuligerus]
MGGAMARNLLTAGFPVTVHDIRREAAAAHLAAGADWADSAADCAAAVDVLITMLPGPRQVEAVLLHAGAAAALRPGSTWIDMSTSAPATARRIAEQQLDGRGVRHLDAPVSGMAKGAEAGTLQIFAGGDAAVYTELRPVLTAMGDPERIFHVGPRGTGYTVKLMINLLWFSHLVATSEVLTLGVKAGVDLAVLRDSLIASPANSNFLEHDIQDLLTAGDYDESFAMALACKDLGLAVDLGRDVGVPVELSALVEQIYRRGLAQYGGPAGEMIPVRLYEELAGIELRIPAGPGDAR